MVDVIFSALGLYISLLVFLSAYTLFLVSLLVYALRREYKQEMQYKELSNKNIEYNQVI